MCGCIYVCIHARMCLRGSRVNISATTEVAIITNPNWSDLRRGNEEYGISVCVKVCVCVCMHLCTYACLYLCICIYICVCTYVRACVRRYVFVSICMHACMHMCLGHG